MIERITRYFAASVLGTLLFFAPFSLYWAGAGHSHASGPHQDHDPRHGGHLFMLHDHHLEIVDLGDSIDLYLSDSRRRPMRPASCEVAFDALDPVSCEWRSYRSTIAKPAGVQSGLYRVGVDEGMPLSLKFP